MDLKIMLDLEKTENKTGLKHPNEETRLPLITKKKSTPMCRQKPGKDPRVSKPWALPAFHCLARGETPKGGQRLILPAALPAPPAVPRAAPVSESPRQQQDPAVGEIRLCPESTNTIPEPKETISGTHSSGKMSIESLPPSNSMASARKSKPEWSSAAQHLGSEVHIPSQTQLPQTAQPFQDPCLDRELSGDQQCPGFLALQHHHHSIVGTENLLKKHTTNNHKAPQTTSELDFNKNPSKSGAGSVMENQPAVEKLLKPAGQGTEGRAGAAADTQKQQWAAGVICTAWLSWHRLAQLRRALRAAQHRHLENFYSRAKHLAANWNRIRTSRRTIIHIPSLGYSQHVREHIPDLGVQQNLQLGRLCDILDAIYMCPLALSEDLVQYYHQLLALQAAGRSGNPEDTADLQDRFKILTPEAINSFPEHQLCLATVLRYSPRSMQRLQELLQGRDAYLLGGFPHLDDLAVADELQVPLLGSEPAVAQLCSSKSGSKRIFASAGVPAPPGEWGIQGREQLLRALSLLILDHWEVQPWLFKVDGERGGDGTAFCDVTSHLQCHPCIQRQWQGQPGS